jgi:hypothetical protein
MAETTKCASCLDKRDGVENFTKDANGQSLFRFIRLVQVFERNILSSRNESVGWIDFCDTTKDNLAKLSTYSSIFTKTQTTALTLPTTRFSTGMWFTPYSGSSSYSDIFTRGGQPTNLASSATSNSASIKIPTETSTTTSRIATGQATPTTAASESEDKGSAASSRMESVGVVSAIFLSFIAVYFAL